MSTQYQNLRDASINTNVGETAVVGGQQYIKVAGAEGSGIEATMQNVNNYYDPNTKLYHYQGQTYDNPAAYSAAVSGESSTTNNTSNTTGSTSSASALQKLADLTYLAQTTGVASSEINAAYEAAGFSSDDYMGVQNYLKENGYNPGENKTFYGNNTAQDIGAKLLYERWQEAPTEEELEEAGLSGMTVINSNAAASQWLTGTLSNMGISADQTMAITGRTVDYSLVEKYAPGNSFWSDKINQFGSYDGATLDMLEWDNLNKELGGDSTGTTDTGGDGTGLTGTGVGGTDGTGGVSGGFTGTGGGSTTVGVNAPSSITTSNVGMTTPGPSGTYTVPAQTFTQNVSDQAADLQQRATQQNYTTPQTVAEKQAAGQDISSFIITQKLYRNPNTGDQIYIAFQGNRPMQTIPAGYIEIDSSGQAINQSTIYNPVTAGGNTFTSANNGAFIQGYEDGTAEVTNNNNLAIDPEKIYGNVSFQDPLTGETVTQTPQEYFQTLGNKVAQATVNPASSVTMPGTAVMAETGYAYNPDGTIKMDEETGQPVIVDLMPGTVIESTAGQAEPLAPIIGKRQAVDSEGNLMYDSQGKPIMVGADPAQVTDVSQAKGPGTPAVYDAEGNLISEAVDTPTAATASVSTATPGIKKELMGGTTTDYAGMAASVEGAVWDSATGTFKVGDQSFTPDEFIAANNINVGNYMTTTGGLDAATLDAPTQTIDAAVMQKQKIDPVTGEPMFTVDAEGNQVPVMEAATSVSGLDAATGTAQTVADVAGEDGLPVRTLDTTEGQSELITGTGVDQTKVGEAFGTGEVQAASVQDELSSLMAQFEGGETPAWAAGAMRKATALMAERGLGASSMAGQAIIQAAMEAALPIAQIDAGNKQQMALFKAEQRSKFLGMEFDQAFQAKVMNAAKVSEIANINFSAEQQIALENSRAAQTMDLANLNNKQALIMAEAAALSQMDMANLNNLQQAQVQNAQNFLQIDMANLANKQSTALFKSQSITNAMLSDTAQINANEQFNATSENQMTQFSANLSAQVSQFNAAQQNAINQSNAEMANAVLEFNAALQNQREMFNAQNYLVVAQANAKWRQDINTANTAAQNVANLTYAKEVNGLTQKALDDYWQKERDIMSYAFAQSESASDRALKILLGEQSLEGIRMKLEMDENAAKSEWWSDLLFGDTSFADIFKLSTPT